MEKRKYQEIQTISLTDEQIKFILLNLSYKLKKNSIKVEINNNSKQFLTDYNKLNNTIKQKLALLEI